MTDHLVIPDAHTTPDTNNDRFVWAANLAIERQPEVIICLGDLADMESLSSYDKGKKSFEGRRYSRDVEAAQDALRRFNQQLDKYNATRGKAKKSKYAPRKIMLLGNHEERIERAIQLHPEFDGSIGYSNLRYSDFGWDVIPYLKPVNLDGVWYSHFVPSGVMGNSISGTNVARTLLSKKHASCTVGHSHLLDYAIDADPSGRKIMGLSAGCYFEDAPDYAHATAHLWWRGLVYKYNVHDGEYDLETIDIKRMKERYS